MEKQTVYLVTFDGYTGGYGSKINLLGIYSNQEAADKAVEDLKKQTSNCINDTIVIEELVLDHTCTVEQDAWGDYNSSIYLGGYIE